MAAPRVYVRNHSVSLPAPSGTSARLVWCASYGAAAATARYRIMRVGSFENDSGNPQPAALVGPSVRTVTLGATEPERWDREEAGYRWPEHVTTIANTSNGATVRNGLYCIQVSEAGDWSQANHAFFVVRRRTAATRALVCYAFATNVAYAGGKGASHLNLYDSSQGARARRVSLDRPFKEWAYGTKEGYTIVDPHTIEEMIRQLKGENAVDVCTSFDLHEDPQLLDGRDLFVSVGHDEYWSKVMCDRVREFVRGGGNVAFFSANTAWWQVRFEEPASSATGLPLGSRTMVCHKSGVEDPGTDSSTITDQFCSVPAAGLAGDHSGGEENTLTGVSYRRGTQGGRNVGIPFTIQEPRHPYVNGIPGATLGPTVLMGLETDACDIESRDGLPLATGADGTPRNFRAIAIADLRHVPIAQRGMAVMGTYTNIGSVFTAATTDWASHLRPPAHPDVQIVTTNVINDLFTRKTGQSPWQLPPRVYPGVTWSSLGVQSGTIPAICGIIEGHLIAQRKPPPAGPGNPSALTQVLRCDPENPGNFYGPTANGPTAIGVLDNVMCYGSDLWGRSLFAGLSDGRILFRSGSVSDSGSGWQEYVPAIKPGWQVGGIGHAATNVEHAAFALLSSPGASRENILYQIPERPIPRKWHHIGRPHPPIRTMASHGVKLFGVREPGPDDATPLDLFCREASEIDLVWTRIGKVPAGTYALAAYYGRLFALAGTSTNNPTLYWRAAVAEQSYPFTAPRVLFMSGRAGVIGRVAGNGDWHAERSVVLPFDYDLATRVNDGMVFFYSNDGSARLGRIAPDGAFQQIHEWQAGAFKSNSGPWTHVVCLHAGQRSWTDISPLREKVIFYRTGDTWGYIGRFAPTPPYFVEDWHSHQFSPKWTHIACTHAGKLLFYDRSTGGCAWGAVDNDGIYFNQGGATLDSGWQTMVPMGNTYLLANSEATAKSAQYELFSSPVVVSTGPSVAAGTLLVGTVNGLCLTYHPPSGTRHAFGATGGGLIQMRVDARALPTALQRVVALGI